jgi:hypothetical protein
MALENGLFPLKYHLLVNDWSAGAKCEGRQLMGDATPSTRNVGWWMRNNSWNENFAILWVQHAGGAGERIARLEKGRITHSRTTQPIPQAAMNFVSKRLPDLCLRAVGTEWFHQHRLFQQWMTNTTQSGTRRKEQRERHGMGRTIIITGRTIQCALSCNRATRVDGGQ